MRLRVCGLELSGTGISNYCSMFDLARKLALWSLRELSFTNFLSSVQAGQQATPGRNTVDLVAADGWHRTAGFEIWAE